MATARQLSSPFSAIRAVIHATVLASALASGGAAAQPPAALPMLLDARDDALRAEREGKPLILFFSLPGCQFCHVIRQNYLLSLLKERTGRDQPLIREVDITSVQKIVGLDGAVSTQGALAQSLRVRVAPAVLMIDAGGRLLAEPVIGGDVAGLYGGYLDNALSAAEKNLQKK